MNYPENLKYSQDHEWVRLEDGNIAYIGITFHAQQELDELVYIEVDTVDESLNKEDVFGTVEAVKATSDLFMPITGKVLEVNQEVIDEPTVINKDPYDKGWIIKVAVRDLKELDELLTSEGYKELIGE